MVHISYFKYKTKTYDRNQINDWQNRRPMTFQAFLEIIHYHIIIMFFLSRKHCLFVEKFDRTGRMANAIHRNCCHVYLYLFIYKSVPRTETKITFSIIIIIFILESIFKIWRIALYKTPAMSIINFVEFAHFKYEDIYIG